MHQKSPSVRFGRSAGGTQPKPTQRMPRQALTPAESRWKRLSWPLSIALFVVPVLLLLGTLVAPRLAGAPQVTVQVSDRYTGQAIANAQVTVDGAAPVAASNGALTVPLTKESLPLVVEAPGYEGISTSLVRGGPADWQVALRPNVLSGNVIDAESSAGIAGAEITLIAPEGVQLTTTSDGNGSFQFSGVPEGGTLKVYSAAYGTSEQAIERRLSIDIALKPTFVSGTVLDANGAAVPGARVMAANGSAEAVAGPDGGFDLTGGSDVAEVVVSAPGFSTQTLPVDASRHVAAQLEPEMIKAIYANFGVLGDEARWNGLLEIADTTEINAIVIDVKQDTIYYDTQVPFFQNVPGMVTPLLDMDRILADMDAHGLYAIARMVVFKDPVVAAGRPDLAVMDENTGTPWLDMNDTPWVNAFYPELWQANADLAAELTRMGFDEVQYDYIRFPSDGDLRTADFGNSYSEAERRAAITGAVSLAEQQVHDAGGTFSIDLFPIVALLGDDQGIGQTLQDLTPIADYVSLMIYPSHFQLGNIPDVGEPNDYPAETVTYTLERSQVFAPDSMKKMRPWLQDFTYPAEGYAPYGPAEVRAQIDAAEAMGVSGWILWNAAGEFEVDALRPA